MEPTGERDDWRGRPAEMTGSRLARAYCGPAHGYCWPVAAEDPPPEDVVLEIAAEPLTYRLVHHPRSRRPARDQRGRYLYMPLLYNA